MRKLLLCAVLFTFLACEEEKAPQLKTLEGNAFGTTYGIQYFTDSDLPLQKGIDSIIHAVNKSVSTYMPNSDISKINQGDSTVVVDEIFKDVFELSAWMHRESDGYFDPTVGVLRNAYGFGDEKPLAQIDSLTLDSLMTYVGFKKVSLTEEGTIKKANPNIYFDFNAVAKGHGIDLIGEYMESQGVKNYLIELGGELRAKGMHIIKQQPWVAGIESVSSDIHNRSIDQMINLKDQAMASSGNYRKFRIDSATGKRYVHTINPLTGKAEQLSITSATVVAPTCAEADAFATAFMAMDVLNAKRLLKESVDIEAYLTYINSRGQSQYFMSGGFLGLLKKDENEPTSNKQEEDHHGHNH
ncbi:MAG: FAD:protein FMN transferase [Flavobacteriaceae bacterium]|nr:FAD:protein FMN transferase [Flavobacteriaceae bacterium]